MLDNEIRSIVRENIVREAVLKTNDAPIYRGLTSAHARYKMTKHGKDEYVSRAYRRVYMGRQRLNVGENSRERANQLINADLVF